VNGVKMTFYIFYKGEVLITSEDKEGGFLRQGGLESALERIAGRPGR
jgi:hypothetical protein